MTEEQWLNCTDPTPMLQFLRSCKKAMDRKLRLIGCAYCRSVWHLLGTESRRAVLLAERMADGPVSDDERKAVIDAAIAAVRRFDDPVGDFYLAADMAYRLPCNDGWYAAEWTIGNNPDLPSAVLIIKDVIGNLFRLKPKNSVWPDRAVRLAAEIYANRDFATKRLAELGDALQQPGCHDEDILRHCRRPDAVHVRGCFVVDAILGKA